jgi:hypothetical protein
MIVMSIRANERFADTRRLPMQWSVSGAVTWTAPRLFALAFTPLLAAVILLATAIASVTLTPRPGQESYVAPVVAIISLGFVATHALHLWLTDRMLKRNDR